MNTTNHSAPPNDQVTVLIVDDDATFHSMLALGVLGGRGYHLHHAFAGWQAVEMLAQHSVDVVVLDLDLPDGNGFRVLEDMRQQGDRAVPIVISAYVDPPSRQRARAAGAWEVIDKRYEDYRQLPQLIARAMTERARSRRAANGGRPLRPGIELPAGDSHSDYQPRISPLNPFARLERSSSMAMQRLIKWARDTAQLSGPVLIRGEPGSERELVARYIHANSQRSYAPFVATVTTPRGGLVSALGPASAESLFAAGSGTIFIDQVHQLDRDWQDLLLAFLDRANERAAVGARVPAPGSTTARVLVGSTDAVDSSSWIGLDARLREAWSGSQLVILPLRERPTDVAGELEFLLAEAAITLGVNPPRCTPELVTALSRYQFPGNEQELRAMAMLGCARKPGGWLELHDVLSAEAIASLR